MSEYLNFNDISQQIPIKKVLDWLNIPYTEKKGELKGKIGEDGFIANIQKNSFFCPKNDNIKGGIINFVSQVMNLSLRDAASALKVQFLREQTLPKREIPDLELHYCKYLETCGIKEETAKKYEVGFVKQKSVINGRIAFKIYDHEGNHIGYVGFNETKKDWFFPKNFKRPLYNYHLYKSQKGIFLTSNPFITLYLRQLGLNSCSLLGKSMTDQQEEVLKTFGNITLIHSELENIINRLYPYTFIKAPKIVKSLKDYSVEEIVCF